MIFPLFTGLGPGGLKKVAGFKLSEDISFTEFFYIYLIKFS